MTAPDATRAWLARAWWVLVPAFAILVARLVFERTCASPNDLLPTMTAVPLVAWGLATLYLGSHVWLAAAYVLTVERTGTLVPTWSLIRRAWDDDLLKVVVATVVVAVEYAPAPWLQAIGHRILHCG